MDKSHTETESRQPAPPRRHTEPSGWRDLVSVAGVLLGALVLAVVLVQFVFQSYRVDGPSMQPTLEHNDHLIIWKVPRTIARVTDTAYIPNRGDVIVFNLPAEDNNGVALQLVKRVVGLPGDRVIVRDGQLTVINREHPDGYNPDKALPYGTAITTTPGNEDVRIKAGEVFAIGDHRDNSRDSRDFGPVPAGRIVGKLVLRMLPLQNIKLF